jgi:hypothetical protein
MKMKNLAATALLALLGGCNQAAEKEPVANESSQPEPTPVTNLPAPPVALPDDRTPLEEPKGPIDPKSAEAAGQVVQHYGALIEQGRWSEANAYWGDAATAARFRGELAGYSEVHIEIGKPGDSEGAAGSIYITDPVVFSGKRKSGAVFRRGADVTLRRVNDVPGSTEAQRRWHIERIDWKG